MTRPLHRLAYVSRNVIDADARDVQDEIDQLLSASVRNNAAVEVTGALMFNAGCFAQVLEGPLDAVEATFERIQLDDRHREVRLLSFDTVEARGFPDWSMAYVGTDTAATRTFAAIAADEADLTALAGERIHTLLREHLAEAEARHA